MSRVNVGIICPQGVIKREDIFVGLDWEIHPIKVFELTISYNIKKFIIQALIPCMENIKGERYCIYKDVFIYDI